MATASKCFPANGVHVSRAKATRVLDGAEVMTVDPSTDQSNSASVQTKQNWDLMIDAFFGIVQDSSAEPSTQRKAALKIAEFFLPKTSKTHKKAKLPLDEYGFAVDPKVAKKYRRLRHQLVLLKNGRNRDIPAVAQKIGELATKLDKIRRRFPVPCPSKYGAAESARDLNRLSDLADLNRDNGGLSEVEAAEEAYLWARRDAFDHSPEQLARQRLKELHNAERRSECGESTGASRTPITDKERDELRDLRKRFPALVLELSRFDAEKASLLNA